MSTKRWVAIDPEDGFSFHDTEEQAIDAAQKAIDGYLDDIEWARGVEGVCVAQVRHCSTEVDRVERPEVLDDYGTDEEGNHWQQDWQYQCNYQMKAVEPPNGWIVASEKTPTQWASVLGHIVAGGLVICGVSLVDVVAWTGTDWVQSLGGEDVPVSISHWMALPDRPSHEK